MDGTHGHFNINADVGASEFLFDQSFEESYIQYVPQQQMPYDMPYITTEFQPSAIASPLNGYPTRFHQRIDAYNNNSQPPAPQPSLQPNDTQLRRKRKADDDDPLPSSVRIKKEHLDTMYTAPDSSQDTNADHCTYFPEDNLKLSVDDSFQFPESFVPDKSHLLPYVGQMLMNIAHAANHEYPLLIAIDQENGMLNNLYDKAYLTQFPGNMAVVATGKKKLAKDVARAMGKELKALGINWVLGPVVDVLTNSTNRLLGVRTMGEDPEQVSDYAEAFLEGYKEAGIACCGKHFPGYGNASVNSTLDLPVVPESLQQLETASLIPYKRIIEKNVDAIMLEAISGILGGVRDEIFAEQVVIDAAKRVTDMKKRYLSWGDALAPPELSYLLELKKSHQDLSSEAYKNSDDKPNESSRASSEHSIEESTHTVGRSGTVDLVEWFNHAGWNISAGRKSGNGAHANEVHTMKVNVENSNPRFEIPVARGFTLRPYLPEDHDQLLEFVDRHVQRRRDRAGLSLLYMQAQESQISNNSDTSILLYVDMTGRIVGSIISFSMRSNFSVLLPWIFEFENARVGGLCGLIVEQGKLLPKDVEFLKLGLVKKGLNNFIMATDLERCAISGIEGDEEYKLMKSLKFEWWKSYLEVSRKA
ncbi:hypothetical protein DUD61_002633 [Geotrichum candidum]|nr:hypothetical protein DUD61_002633 [Geotrichum candidum]